MNVTWNTVQHGRFSHPFQNKDTLFRMEVVSDLTHEFCYCFDIAINQIRTKYGHLLQWHCDFLGGFSKECDSSFPNKIWALSAVKLWLFILGISNNLATSLRNKIWAPGALRLYFFWRVQMSEHFHQKKYLISTRLLSTGWMQIRFEW